MQSQVKTNQFIYFCSKCLLLDFATNLFISKLVLKCKIFHKLLKFVAGGQLLWVYAEISAGEDYSWDTELAVHFQEHWVKMINKAESKEKSEDNFVCWKGSVEGGKSKTKI